MDSSTPTSKNKTVNNSHLIYQDEQTALQVYLRVHCPFKTDYTQMVKNSESLSVGDKFRNNKAIQIKKKG